MIVRMVTGAIALVATLGGPASLGASSPVQLDSQYVLQRYTLQIEEVPRPQAVIFSYTVSQAGPNNIEAHHRIYRSGLRVRDETLAVDGVALRSKRVRFGRRDDRYAIRRIAPRTDDYQLLFLQTIKDGRHLDYVYDSTPLIGHPDAWIDRVTIDGVKFLPRSIHFHTRSVDASGAAQVAYAPFGKYWMPVLATASATVNGKPARERIVWSDYRFPARLPPSTFEVPKPLPQATLPPF